MRRWFYRVAAAGILAPALVFGQQASNDSSNTLRFENGTVTNGSYSNECLGFSLPIPAGWEIADSKIVGADGRARHTKSGLTLLLLSQQKEKAVANTIVLSASDAAGKNWTAQDFVSNYIHPQISTYSGGRELIEDAFPLDYRGKLFFRASFKQAIGNAGTLYVASVFTKFRGYFIGETITAGSSQELNQAADSLTGISFQEDKINSKCSMSPENAPAAEGLSGGLSGPAPNGPESHPAQPQRVRVAQQVSTGLLIKKVSPQYPEEARQAWVQGQVVLKAVINKSGDIVDLTLVSGHPMLAPAAIEAVKQWKYKPYLLDGQPVAVSTQVIVNFALSEH